MLRTLGTIVLLLACACTERNPEYCGDGTCVDPKLPFCDVDGSFSGIPGTCIAVQCEPAEFARCRGEDTAITCSATGKNYDIVKCPMGCDVDASGCIECATNEQCDTSQVCDAASGHCRGCLADDECDSRVCDLSTGACVAESAVVYASPNGTGTCSLSQPCSLTKAYSSAANAAPPRLIRMLPGTYTSALRADVLTSSPVRVIATDANIVVVGDVAAIVVDGGASLEVRNLSSASERQVQCGLASTSAPQSTISLSSAKLSMVGMGLAFETQRCELSLRDVDLTTNVDIIGTRNDTSFKADGFYVHGSGTVNTIVGAGSRVSIDIVNAVLEDTSIVTFFSDTSAPGSSVRFAYSTLLLRVSQNVCDGITAQYRSVLFENTIVASQGAFDTFANPNPANCTFVGTMLTRQSNVPPGAVVADPRFVDLGTHDYHLQAGSPAIDAAVQATANPDHDLEGVSRPQGVKADLGAYEYR
jgi:hypothetical protein